MVATGEECRTLVFPSHSLLSKRSGISDGNAQSGPGPDVKPAVAKVVCSRNKASSFTHGLRHLQHFSCDSPVRYLMYSEAAAAFISLHADNTCCFYKPNCDKYICLTHSALLPFKGLTATKTSGYIMGWGPGPVLTLLDSELKTLEEVQDAPDVCVCQAADHSTEVVTAGVGNVCVWSVMLMRCKVKIVEGLHHSTVTHMALAPPHSERPHRAFVVCGHAVTVVDLEVGNVLDHKNDLCSRDITAITYCSQQDCLIVASKELSIKVWGPDWELRSAFVGHNGMVKSLLYCSEVNMLLSASVDCTIRGWNVEEGNLIECIHTEKRNPPLGIECTRQGDSFLSFSRQGVDLWTFRSLYALHSELAEDRGPLRQILVPALPAPYPTRVLCVRGDTDIILVTAETGAVLTSFRGEQRILSADYCLHKELLLGLTETGTVLQANTLTNPITLLDEWRGRGQGPWRQKHCHTIENDTQNLSAPGPACSLVLYSYVADPQGALEEWRDLQEWRGCSNRDMNCLDDAKNKFLVILGQRGGCVSVLTLKNGNILCRMPAHNGQTVTTMQVYPERGCLLSAGEDKTVVVWLVNPCISECLTKQMSLYCGQSHVYLAVQGPRLALTFEEPASGTYSLMHFNFTNQTQTDHPPREEHSDHFTGLCVCPDLEVFVSSSLDGTVRIWNEENRLISTLQLNAVPECVGYSGFGDVLLGIKGSLYKMNCAKFLPRYYQKMLFYTYHGDPLPDLPIAKTDESPETQTVTRAQSEVLPALTNLEHESLGNLSVDLAALVQGTVKCTKPKPPSTKETRTEAFNRYMRMIYGLPYNIKGDLEDSFDPDMYSFDPVPFTKPCDVPTVAEDVSPKINIPVHVEKKKIKQKKKPCEPETISKPVTPRKVKQCVLKADSVTPEEPVIVEKPQEMISPVEEPKPLKPKPLTPVVHLKSPAPQHPTPPPPPREPSPELPAFLKEFADTDWFKELYPDDKSVLTTLSPDDFSLQLLAYFNTRTTSAPSRITILTALQTLHMHGLIRKLDKLHRGLIDSVPRAVKPHMSPYEQAVLGQMLHLMLCLKPAGSELVINLLTLLAYKNLGLRGRILHMLTALGVDEVEQWLWPELESWESELPNQSDVWKSLYNRAKNWLEMWTSKYKDCNKYLFLKRTEDWKPASFSVVDVLNYFCSVQKEAKRTAPARVKNTVFLPLYDCVSHPIHRLGETYSMSRIRKPQGLILPPLRNRPSLMHFPKFIALPLPHITLSPFHIYSDEDWLKAPYRRYFIQQQSHVEYYR